MNQKAVNTNELLNYLSTSKGFVYCFIIAFAIAILIFCLVFLLIYKSKTEKNIKKCSLIIFIVTAIMGFILYFIGYSESNKGIFISCLKSIISTARMFFLNYDLSEIKTSSDTSLIMNSAWFLPIYWIVHVFALISSIFGILALFGRKLIENIILFFKFDKTIYVICGANSKSICLAKSLMFNKNRLVIIIDKNANDSISKKIQDLGVILIKEPFFESGKIDNKLLNKIGLTKKHLKNKLEFFLFEDDETYNVSIAKELINVAKENGVDNKKLRIFIESNDKLMLSFMEEILTKDVNYDVNIISEADLATRKLMQDYPIVERLDIDTDTATIKDKDFTILVVGFGKIGREVLFKSICNGQFIARDKKVIPFNAIVVDEQWENKSWQFRNIHPYIEKEYPGILFKPYSSNSNEFFELLKEKINDINYIVIATENDKNNLELAKSIQILINNNNIEWGKRIMAVHMRNQSNLMNEANENAIFKYIKFFGEYEDIFTEDIIVNETMDILAKKINSNYNFQYIKEKGNIDEKSIDNWCELELIIKNSNRAAAEHLSTKLALLGYEINNQNDTREFDGELTLDEYINYEQLESILRVEHLRWNAFHFVNGWTDFTAEEIEQMKKIKGNKLGYDDRKDKKKRKHSCLVSWENLIDVSNTFCYEGNCGKELKERYPNIIDYQLEDLKLTLNIPQFLNYAGINIRKRRNKDVKL